MIKLFVVIVVFVTLILMCMPSSFVTNVTDWVGGLDPAKSIIKTTRSFLQASRTIFLGIEDFVVSQKLSICHAWLKFLSTKPGQFFFR